MRSDYDQVAVDGITGVQDFLIRRAGRDMRVRGDVAGHVFGDEIPHLLQRRLLGLLLIIGGKILRNDTHAVTGQNGDEMEVGAILLAQTNCGGDRLVGGIFRAEIDSEPPRDCRRLQLLRGWSDDQENNDKIFT